MNAYANLPAKDQQSALEDLLDAVSSTEDLLAMLRNIAYEKAEHVASNWQGDPTSHASNQQLARQWDRIGTSLDRECNRLAKIGNPYA